MKLIGISGKKESGKDTVARMLTDINKKYKRSPFAYSLKATASLLTGIHISMWDDREFKENYCAVIDTTPRDYMQRLGDAMRLFDEEVFIKACFNNMHESESYIITDVRYKNEAEAIKKRGGYVIRVNRSGIAVNNHVSETDLDDYKRFDCIIEN